MEMHHNFKGISRNTSNNNKKGLEIHKKRRFGCTSVEFWKYSKHKTQSGNISERQTHNNPKPHQTIKGTNF